MNKFIKYDILNGLTQMKAGIMNALHEVLRNNVNEIDLGDKLSYGLILECFNQLGLEYKIRSLDDEKYISTDNIYVKHNINTGKTICKSTYQ